MKTNKVLVAVLVVVAVIATLGLVYPSVTKEVVREVKTEFGASSQPTERYFFKGGLTDGSGCFATSTTGTLTNADLNRNNCIYLTATGAGQGVISLTMPASTTVSYLNDAGSCTSWFVDASDLAAATTTTIVAGTGNDVVGLDATGAGTGADVLDGGEYGKITSCRQSDGDIVTFVEEYLDAD